jgi:NADH-quinone oxidoreductase subunit E
MHDLSLYLLELLENATRAGSDTIRTTLTVERRRDTLELAVEDDGRGLDVTVEQVLDPFYTTKSGKRTGLGLSLFKAEAEAAGGGLTIDTSPSLGGVRVTVGMRLSSVDRPPTGDLVTTLRVMAVTNPQIDFRVSVQDRDAQVDVRDAPFAEAAASLKELALRLDGPPEGTAPEYTADATQDRLDTEDADTKRKECGMANDPNDRPGTCCCGEEPSEEELLARLDEVIATYKDKQGGLIPALQIAQGIFGYLPEVALKRIAMGLDKPYSEVAGVVGFYSFFSTVPRGRNVIRVCLGTACYVRGGMPVLDALKKELGIEVGETTEDREFSLEVARCFGACGLAPVITVNDEVHHRVKPKRVRAIIAQYAPAEVAERSA